jgi:hypothetical protein
MQRAAFVTWMALRITRWACWIGLLVYAFMITSDRSTYLGPFGQALRSTEAWLFGLVFAAATAGFLELMMREKAGIARPEYFKLTPPEDEAAS